MLTVKNPKTFDWANIPLKDCMEGNAFDAYYTLQLFHIFKEEIEKRGMTHLYEKLLVPATQYFAFVEHRGLDIDPKQVEVLGGEILEAREKILEKIRALPFIKEDDSFSATTCLQEILYTREGALELYPPDKTKTKSEPSTSADTLKILLSQINEVLINE